MEENMTNGNSDAPTEKQLAVIRRLIKQTNSDVAMKDIATRREASKVIEKLIGERSGAGRQGPVSNRNCAYGLATSLVHTSYLAVGKMPMGSEGFWKKVDEFYRQYLQHMNQAV